jgi:2-polyprenyl-6-methoxyphenol hydroxylase-like FAD-dependent oxidoreductase
VTQDLSTDVVVVGAGPVGLMLAGELRLRGAAVVVLERRDTPDRASKASTLHARTMEIFDSRGLLTRLGDLPPNEPMGHFGGLPLDLTLPSPYPGQWKVPQTRTEEILQAWAQSLGADLRRGHPVRELAGQDDRVEAVADGPAGPLRVRGRYLVACDGEDSTVRRLLAAGFPGRDAEHELLRADVAGIQIPDRRFQRLDRGLAVAARRGDGVTRVMVHEFGTVPGQVARQPTFADAAAAWRRVTGEDISGGAPLWVNSFGDASRQLASYRHGRVLFAGDAAHRQMPAGGQALNLGLQDAVNLGWKLAARLRDRTADDLLDSYHRERHAVGRRVLENIKVQAMLLFGGPEVEELRTLLGELIALEPARRHLAGMISGLDVRYDAGAGDHPLLGARLPETTLATAYGRVTTNAQLRAGGGLLLDLTGEPGRYARLRALADAHAPEVKVLSGQAEASQPEAGYELPQTVLVRPDGYVAWTSAAGGGADGPDLEAALRRWFPGPEAGPLLRRAQHGGITEGGVRV